MKRLALLLLFISPLVGSAQDTKKNIPVDSLYREDQFYTGITYNLLVKMPSGVAQNGFSSGFQIGFIRDMPINKKRNLALGLGLGYAANSFNQNISITKDNNRYTYAVIPNSDFTKNKFFQHVVEVPFELRYRKSTPTEHKFFRLYTGFKVGYVFANKYKFRGVPQNYKLSNINDFNRLQYALTLSLGYNTWNFYVHYGLNSIFDSNAQIDGKAIKMKTIKIGLIFYVL